MHRYSWMASIAIWVISVLRSSYVYIYIYAYKIYKQTALWLRLPTWRTHKILAFRILDHLVAETIEATAPDAGLFQWSAARGADSHVGILGMAGKLTCQHGALGRMVLQLETPRKFLYLTQISSNFSRCSFRLRINHGWRLRLLVSCDPGSWTKTYRILQEMHSVDCSCRDSVKPHTVCIQKACSTIWRVHLMISCVLSRPVLLLSLKTDIICMSFAMICAMIFNFWTFTISHVSHLFHLNQEKLEHLRWKIAGQLYHFHSFPAFVAPVGAPPRRGE